MKIEKKNSEGQALVLVLLSLAVVLTLVLFILARSVTDVAVTSTQEEAVRAFSAAEAGVENALVIGAGSGSTQIGDAKYQASVSSYAQGSTSFVYPVPMDSGDSATTWFVSHNDTGDLTCGVGSPCFTGDRIQICWGKVGTASGTSTTPAVELNVFYTTTPGDFSTVKIARAAFDPNSSRRSSNSFSSPDAGTCQIGGITYAFTKTVLFSSLGIPALTYQTQNGLQFAKVRMFYNTDQSHEFGLNVNFAGNSTLPSQGSQIDSTGTAGLSNRRISVFQSWPEVPSIFEYAVFSSNGLTK